jgi:ubiquinone/menaquinone biosynthesis C-methylase UbiE
MSERPYVFEATLHDAELKRLRALEAVFDPATRQRLLATGLGAGWRCLEVGAGAGSIAQWLAKTVGPSGHVLAVDTNTRFLKSPQSANVDVLEADIQTTALDAESFDLAHARFVLIHVPAWAEALAAIIRCLKPGGWLVLEEPDFSSSRAVAGPPELRRAFENVHQAITAMFRQREMDPAFGARLPALLQEHQFAKITIENDAAIVPGGSPHAQMMRMSTYQLRDKYVATGLATEEDIEHYGTFAADPTCWATYHATIRATAQKPGTAT